MAGRHDDWWPPFDDGLAAARDTLLSAIGLLVLQAPVVAIIIILAYVLGVARAGS